MFFDISEQPLTADEHWIGISLRYFEEKWLQRPTSMTKFGEFLCKEICNCLFNQSNVQYTLPLLSASACLRLFLAPLLWLLLLATIEGVRVPPPRQLPAVWLFFLAAEAFINMGEMKDRSRPEESEAIESAGAKLADLLILLNDVVD